MPAGKVQLPSGLPAAPGAATPGQTPAPGKPQAPGAVKPGTLVGTSASDGPGIIHCKCLDFHPRVQLQQFSTLKFQETFTQKTIFRCLGISLLNFISVYSNNAYCV